MHENKRTNFEVGQFQTEVKQLLDIVINSLYTEREIFLRELISNAADALERFRYESLLSKDNTGRAPQPLAITIDLDLEQHRISITDAGIGMTKEELIENLGTIAHSGSKKFVKQLTATGEKDLN
ncbi:MAG: Chaperone protein HtpG, partial [Pelotomaculum thermopropionicum]